MKINWNEKDKTKAIYSGIVIFVSILFFFFVYRLDGVKEKIGTILGVFTPFVIGGVFAFLLNLPLSFIEKKFEKFKFYGNLKQGSKRKVSIIITYILFILFIVLFFSLLIPQLYDAIKALIDNASVFFTNNSYKRIDEFLKNLNIDESIINYITGKIEYIVKYVTSFMSGLLPVLGNVATGVVTTTINWFIGFIVSIYLLFEKERFGAMSKKVSFSFFPKSFAENLLRILQRINITMKNYISGQLIVISILGIIMFASLSILGVKGAVAMAFIIAITDLIPFIGPWIGAMPVFLMISVQDFNKALIFIVIILIMQQVEENLIRPRVQSDKLGISSFWILASILIGGSLFGLVGMIVGIPLFVVFYQLIKEISEYLLNKKGLPLNTDDYLNTDDFINDEDGDSKGKLLNIKSKK